MQILACVKKYPQEKRFEEKTMVDGYNATHLKWWVGGSFNSFTAEHSCITQIHWKLRVNSRGWFLENKIDFTRDRVTIFQCLFIYSCLLNWYSSREKIEFKRFSGSPFILSILKNLWKLPLTIQRSFFSRYNCGLFQLFLDCVWSKAIHHYFLGEELLKGSQRKKKGFE